MLCEAYSVHDAKGCDADLSRERNQIGENAFCECVLRSYQGVVCGVALALFQALVLAMHTVYEWMISNCEVYACGYKPDLQQEYQKVGYFLDTG